jgi:NAD(P)-dependent dehydrogenase (short-subunit alcohol dehydrogenase family)
MSRSIHALLPRLTPDASVVLFGGQARERPYPGSTTVTAVNGAVTTMVRTLTLEIAPIRVNAIHPGWSATARPGPATPPPSRTRARPKRPAGGW